MNRKLSSGFTKKASELHSKSNVPSTMVVFLGVFSWESFLPLWGSLIPLKHQPLLTLFTGPQGCFTLYCDYFISINPVVPNIHRDKRG